ncbi:MAG: hypothetical protein AB4426_18560 [Xenococcaceae cyanobacterium]
MNHSILKSLANSGSPSKKVVTVEGVIGDADAQKSLTDAQKSSISSIVEHRRASSSIAVNGGINRESSPLDEKLLG